MWHPNPEELARLLDEPPTAAEDAHLDACPECASELDAMRAERDALAALPRILPVPTSWDVMRQRLERAGILTGGTTRTPWMPGIAAALALFLAGGAVGVVLAGGSSDAREAVTASEPSPAAADPAGRRDAVDFARTESTREQQPVPATPPRPRAPEPREAASLAAFGDRAGSSGRARSASTGDELPSLYGTPGSTPDWDMIAARVSHARTADEAARYMREAEGAYLAAMTRLAELTEVQTSDPAVRLATLDGIVVTTGAALERAPADPVINGYHLAARAQRDALLRTVSSTPEQDPWY